MKMTLRKTILQGALCLTICLAWLMNPAASLAQTIGSWLTAPTDPSILTNNPLAYDEGWQRGQGGFGPNGSIFAVSNCPNRFELKTNVAANYSQSLAVHENGFGNVRLFINFSGAQIQAFTNQSKLNFTFSCDSSASSGSTAGFMQMVQFQCNSSGAGFQSPSVNTAGGFSETGDTNNNSNGQPIFFFFAGSPARQQVVTWNYSSLKPAIIGSTFVQLVFVFQTGGGAPTNIYLNNINLSGTPTTISYIVDDFATNGVSPTNPTNHNYYAAAPHDYSAGDITAVWLAPWFGNGLPVLSWNSAMDANGDTNSGALQMDFTWTGRNTDGYQQWVLYHGFSQNTFVPVPGGDGVTGIGFPNYTNLECDVRFDGSSANLTNVNFPAGVYGVLRLGIRPAGSGAQAWQPNANYTTITDTNWHHMSMALTPDNPLYGNIAEPLLGEDISGYVDPVVGMVGAQRLYVDNIKFTGPLVAATIPPPTITAPVKATPGLRIFAGSTANTYDRQQLATVDLNQSWIGGTYPVKYTYSLMNYDPTITQVHLELTPGGAVGQYTDYVGNNLVWMVLNPGPVAGQVVCNVQWKTNSPNTNPGGTGVNSYGNALSFTNSTAVGTWSLVFTGPNNGYVAAPGSVVLGPTNFTIADGDVAIDFANPLQAVFGIQPNSTAGQGRYLDYGMISVTGVIGVNEFEDFTKEGSDITANVTPSGQFNNGSSYLAASTIIVTTNDALWINWTQPANGFTLSTTTNLAQPNWINPGWYSGYSDTNAPRVMPLPQAFASKFWVLLPKDTIPTASGAQNPTPPAALPPAPTAFFRLATNVVSP
jgi:hypothetical protein